VATLELSRENQAPFWYPAADAQYRVYQPGVFESLLLHRYSLLTDNFFFLPKNLKTVFLPEGANQWLVERFKLGGGKEKEKKEKKEKTSVPAKRKAPTTKTNGHAK